MDETAQVLARELVATDRLARQAQARRTMLVAEFATNYSVGHDDVLPVLAERRVPLGPGAPSISEFTCLEVAGLLGTTPRAAAGMIADAVNLRHRHPGLYAQMVDLAIDPDRACTAARKCQDLPAGVADEVTNKWLEVQHRHGWSAAFNHLARLVTNADPERAARRERRMRTQLGVHVWGLHEGTMNLTGRLETLDARYLDAAVERIAQILATETPGATKDVLRARALGVLSNPARALAMLQQAAQPRLPAPEGPEDARTCHGPLCGTITTPLHKLRPRLGIAVHLHVDALGNLEGAARVERAGHIAVQTLAEALPGIDVTVQPVVDLNEVPPEDQYVPSIRMREAVHLASPHELFPFSDRAGPGLDLDHTLPYRARGPGQTRMGNLAPLSRIVHRAKTRGCWKVEQPRSMLLVWQSPLGFRYEVHPQAGTRRVVETGPLASPELLRALPWRIRGLDGQPQVDVTLRPPVHRDG